MVEALRNDNSLATMRDNAILQIGFFGALRRSEIVRIHYEHLQWTKEGIEIQLPSSKTDQTHEVQYCAIPYGNETLCPVNTSVNWLSHAKISEGSVFRRIIQNKVVGTVALTSLSINYILLRRARDANLPNADCFSSHSLRRGLATSAARVNTPLHVIIRAGRWKQMNTVMEYIETIERFKQNAASHVLQNINDKAHANDSDP